MADEVAKKSRSKASTVVDPTADTLPSDGDHAARAADPLVGATLGHFRVDALVGRGGMGAVYRAWDTSLERPVALKTLLLDSAPSRARFLREARAQAQLRHPHVVPIHFVGEAEVAGRALTYLVMDLVEGEPLSSVLDRNHYVPEERALDVVDAVAQALEAAHGRGLIHRDIKPSNILVDRDGRVLLADFGLAKALGTKLGVGPPEDVPVSSGPGSSGVVTHAGAIVGTPTYLAPEQASGGVVDHRADIYALGVTLYELLTGEPPFTASTKTEVIEQHKQQEAISPRALTPELRPDVESVVMRMLEKDPAKRFATYADLRSAIAAARARPLTAAPFFPRVVGFAIDFLLFGLAGLLAGMVSGLLVWPAAAVLMGVVEASWGTTPGNRAMGLATVDRFGNRPRYGQAILRAFAKLAGPIAVVFYQAAGVPGLAGKVFGVVLLAAWTVGLGLALGGRHAAFHDRLTRTRVVLSLRGETGRS